MAVRRPVLECAIPNAMSTDAVISGFLRGERDCHAQVDRWIHEVLGHRRFSLGSDLDDVAQEVRRKLLLSFRAERFRGDVLAAHLRLEGRPARGDRPRPREAPPQRRAPGVAAAGAGDRRPPTGA